MSDAIKLDLLAEPEPTERSDAVANRERILDAARRLFARHGVPDVTMADIAKEAGVGKGTLYRRFAHKGELCYALMDEHLAGFQERMLAQMRQMTASGEPFTGQLDVFLDALVQFTEAHMPLLCEVQQAGFLAEASDFSLPHFWQHMTITGLLRTAVAAGELPPGLDIAYAADALLAPLNAQFFRFQRQRRQFTLERISAGLRTMAHGLQN